MISPNYPNEYDDFLDCQAEIVFDEGTKVELHFDHFDLEGGCYDWLEITFGTNESAPGTKSKFCGTSLHEGVITSTGNSLNVSFHSDSSGTRTGFKLKLSKRMSKQPRSVLHK